MKNSSHYKTMLHIALLLVLVGICTIIVTWYLLETEFNEYNAEPGYNVLNNDDLEDGEIVYIMGKDMGSGEDADGGAYVIIDTMYTKNEGDAFNKINITYLPIYFEEPIEVNSGQEDLVIKCRVAMEGENITITGLELYNSNKVLYRFFIGIELIVLVLGLMIYLPASYNYYRRSLLNK